MLNLQTVTVDTVRKRLINWGTQNFSFLNIILFLNQISKTIYILLLWRCFCLLSILCWSLGLLSWSLRFLFRSLGLLSWCTGFLFRSLGLLSWRLGSLGKFLNSLSWFVASLCQSLAKFLVWCLCPVTFAPTVISKRASSARRQNACELQAGNCNTHDAALASVNILHDAVPYQFTALNLGLRSERVKQAFCRYLTTLLLTNYIASVIHQFGAKPFRSPFVHHKSHTDWRGFKPRPQRWDANDCLPHSTAQRSSWTTRPWI